MKRARIRFSPKVYAEIVLRQGGRCACGCREKFVAGEPIQFDHELPLDLEGADRPDNLRALKPKHHLLKTTKEAKARAKVKRIQRRGGMLRKKPSQHDLALARLINLGDGR